MSGRLWRSIIDNVSVSVNVKLSNHKMGEWGRRYFGKYCGYAQEYLYYCWRMRSIVKDSNIPLNYGVTELEEDIETANRLDLLGENSQ